MKVPSDNNIERLCKALVEARVLHALAHPRIVALVAVVLRDPTALICMEYMTNGGACAVWSCRDGPLGVVHVLTLSEPMLSSCADLKTYLRACRPTAVRPRAVLDAADMHGMGAQVGAR